MNRWILLVALVLVQVNTYAEDAFGANLVLNPPPGVTAIDAYFQASAMGGFMCNTAYSMAKNLAAIGETDPKKLSKGDFQGCIQQFTSSLKTLHTRAQKTLKTPAQKKALKEHFVLEITAFQGITPLAQERVIDYERRTNAENRSVEQQKNRFDAEQ